MTEPVMCAADCGRTTRDGMPICDLCFIDIEKWLTQLPDLYAELDTTIAQLGVIGERVGARSGGQPLPVNLHAAETRRTVLSLIRQWSNRFQPVNPPHITGGPICADMWCWHFTCQQIRVEMFPTLFRRDIATIKANLPGLRVDPRIIELHAAVKHAHDLARSEVDRPADRVFVGPCWREADNGEVCTCELYAKVGAAIVKCSDCGTQFDVKERRAWLLIEAENRNCTIGEIINALPNLLEKDINRQTVYSWVRRKRLVPHGHSPVSPQACRCLRAGFTPVGEPEPDCDKCAGTGVIDTEALYLIRDVLDLATNLPGRKAMTA